MQARGGFFIKSGRGEGQALALRQEKRFFSQSWARRPAQVLALRYEEQLWGNEAIGSPRHSAIPFLRLQIQNELCPVVQNRLILTRLSSGSLKLQLCDN